MPLSKVQLSPCQSSWHSCFLNNFLWRNCYTKSYENL